MTEEVTPRATLVRADNPGVMTLDGTNTWVLREPGRSGVVVLDPGPFDEAHLQRVLDVAAHDGGRVELVLYSHWHPDHTDAIDRFFELTGAPARALDEKWCRGAAPSFTRLPAPLTRPVRVIFAVPPMFKAPASATALFRLTAVLASSVVLAAAFNVPEPSAVLLPTINLPVFNAVLPK